MRRQMQHSFWCSGGGVEKPLPSILVSHPTVTLDITSQQPMSGGAGQIRSIKTQTKRAEHSRLGVIIFSSFPCLIFQDY